MRYHAIFTALYLTLVPMAATAETPEERQACTDDAFNVCGDAIPDRDRVAACLARNISRISDACRTVMLRYQTPEVPVAVSNTSKNFKQKAARTGSKHRARHAASAKTQPPSGAPLRLAPDGKR
jgi:hypothetical protein